MGYHVTFSNFLKIILNLNTYELLYWRFIYWLYLKGRFWDSLN